MSRVIRHVAAVLLVLALGLHWMVLQSVAWTSMLVQHAQNEPIRVALVKTFNGENPCQLCKVVAEGAQTEKQQERLSSIKKLEMSLASDRIGLTWDDASGTAVVAAPRSLTTRTTSPPTPPPRIS